MEYSITYVKEVVGGRWLTFHSDAIVSHLLLDSRRLIFPAASLFFGLKGRRDGGSYAGELYRRGVRNFVVEEGSDVGAPAVAGADGSAGAAEMAEANIIVVADALAALQTLVAVHRSQFALPVIGITGSNGKTIVKEWLHTLLGEDYRIVRSPKSYNSQTGVALSVAQLGPREEMGIFEAGISRRGEMRRLEPMIRPTIGVFTNIGEAHSEGFGSLAEKAAEKFNLFVRSEVLVYCADQEETVKAVRDWKSGPADGGQGRVHPQLWSWGRGEANAVRIGLLERGEGWTKVGVHCERGDGNSRRGAGNSGSAAFTVELPFSDPASVENALHCVAVLLWLGIPAEKIVARLRLLTPIAMRLELKNGIGHCSVINDSYSADLSSLSIALDFLSQQQQHPRRTVILSDFLESGRQETELYGAIAKALQQKKVDRLIGIGTHIGAHARLFHDGFSGEAHFYPTVEAFRDDLPRLHFRDETILIKGARVFEFETIDKLLTEQIHQTVLEVDLGAMAANLRAYRGLLEPQTRVMAMVKAFGYGSGSYEIANLLQFHGIDYLGVAYADEGVVLRKAGIRVPIMIMNTETSSFDSLVEYNLEPVVYSLALAQRFDRWLKKEGVPVFPVHLELETGMNRLGIAVQELESLVSSLPAWAFKIVSVFSHFAASEDAQQDEFTRRQGKLYREMTERIGKALGYRFLRHMDNSAGIVRQPGLQMDMVRLGIGLYGIDPAGSAKLTLQEVSTLKSTIAQTKRLHAGETVGYNRQGQASEGTIIATVRIGYADGYARALGNGAGKMWVRGHLAPTIGTVSMDMTMIDVTHVPGVREGDEVVVFGKELSVNQLAKWAGTIPYEILTGVSARVKRIYFEE
ncbi:MAG TPA: bifunctional UDP-N-acetylmuramoyl-tripeptide:D-alanyl-D-alanine ligase/alanine racemase [Puia sp.]|nr:bifunctional UDP-N-acetylmuramoyl-tripeptide:D-alanyl-D-alanine ligase/alanine racemase [Puia sp.]